MTNFLVLFCAVILTNNCTHRMVSNIKEIAKRTAVANKLVKSVNVAIMKVQNDGAENKDVSFFLPDAGTDLTQLGQAGDGSDEGDDGKPRQPSIAVSTDY